MVENVTPLQAWQALQGSPQAQMVDVRTDAEWTYVGFPDLSSAGKRLLPISWQLFPAMTVNEGFVDALRAAMREEREALGEPSMRPGSWHDNGRLAGFSQPRTHS